MSATYDLKASLLRRAWDRGEPEGVLRVQKVIGRARESAAPHQAGLFNFLERNMGQPRAVMSLNALAEREGVNVRFGVTSTVTFSVPGNDTVN